MASYSRIAVIAAMQKSGLTPVFFHKDINMLKEIIMACHKAGLTLFEFTNRGDFAHELFSELNKFALKECPGLIMGAGTVMDAATASLYIQLGANFIVSPVLKEETAIVCNRRKILWIPGCGTATEISRAEELGAEIVKIFPANVLGGPDYVKSIKGPMPWCNLMPSGGVELDEKNLKAWFDAGTFCVGMGSNLFTKDILSTKNFAELENKVRFAIEIINRIRGVQ